MTNYAYWITTRLHRDPSKVEEGLTRPFLLVLDELNYAVTFGLVPLQDAKALLHAANECKVWVEVPLKEYEANGKRVTPYNTF